MAHYAKVDQGKVIKVIVAESDFFDTFIDSVPGDWIQTSYNTRGGVHILGGTPLRKNFAGTGMTYDEVFRNLTAISHMVLLVIRRTISSNKNFFALYDYYAKNYDAKKQVIDLEIDNIKKGKKILSNNLNKNL